MLVSSPGELVYPVLVSSPGELVYLVLVSSPGEMVYPVLASSPGELVCPVLERLANNRRHAIIVECNPSLRTRWETMIVYSLALSLLGKCRTTWISYLFIIISSMHLTVS